LRAEDEELSETKPRAIKVTDEDVVVLCHYDSQKNCDECVWRKKAVNKGYTIACAKDEDEFKELVSMWRTDRGSFPLGKVLGDPPPSLSLLVGILSIIVIVSIVIVIILACAPRSKKKKVKHHGH